MIINTGQRTDIPAFYSEWFANRIKEGFVCVRNPFNPQQVSKYILDPGIVDAIGFCTKNPAPMFKYMDLIKDFGQYWYVTITPYGRDIEPNVPDKHRILEDFRKLSDIVGVNSIGWRYDPIFVSDRYNIEYHLKAFEQMAEALKGYTETVVISFIDLYQKVRRNFPDVKEVSREDQIFLGKKIIEIAGSCNMTVKPCAEGTFLEEYGADCSGCMTIAMYEKAIGRHLNVPKKKPSRDKCNCYLSGDIGAYDSCMHLCRYCYANNDIEKVLQNNKNHDPASPFLIGGYMEDDIIHEVREKSWADDQLSLFDL
ncbi:MAG: DUF1848 domain-containing protein [Butyrivibrio sp.]|uniref:DUF1848 domain-containing protein n=1 Tax=Butyrivibrio sp. TaxID=28121 RepID=UPI0025FF1A2A|nr:DUF1848 domain-containing protein [Butyrivibrio sp.]MCR5769954.1 DUF1848 domain-containing protein [Butyrivibrio sp.]